MIGALHESQGGPYERAIELECIGENSCRASSGVAATAKDGQQQHAVIFGIFHDQCAQRGCHALPQVQMDRNSSWQEQLNVSDERIAVRLGHTPSTGQTGQDELQEGVMNYSAAFWTWGNNKSEKLFGGAGRNMSSLMQCPLEPKRICHTVKTPHSFSKRHGSVLRDFTEFFR